MYRKITDKGTAIRFQMDRGLTNREISKTLEVSESLVRYYRWKLPKKYIDEIYWLGSNKPLEKYQQGSLPSELITN